VKEKHITFEASVSAGHVTLDKVMETPPEYKGNHDLVVDARDRRYYVRLTAKDGWLLPERLKDEAAQVAKNQIEAREPLRN
jgi:hypothetical protein